MSEKEQPPHPCKQQRLLMVCGTLLMVALGWLFSTVHAGEVDRAVMKTKLEQMAADVAVIRSVMEQLVKERKP